MDKKKVLEALNLDLEHEMSAIIRYLHHSFIVTGPLRGSLVPMFRNKATDSMQHAIKLGEKISALGGHPSVKDSGDLRAWRTDDRRDAGRGSRSRKAAFGLI